MYKAVFFFLLFVKSTLSVAVSPSPPPLQFPVLVPDQPGTLQSAVPDLNQNLFTVGTTSTSAFFSKYSSNDRLSWTTSFQSRSSPSLAYDSRYGLYGLIARNVGEEQADVVLVKLNEDNGDVLKDAVVERVRMPNEMAMKVVLVSAEEQQATYVLVVYIVQDGVSPSVSRTKVVQLKDIESGFQEIWIETLTDTDRSARSVVATRYKSGRSILVAEVARVIGRSNERDILSIFELNAWGLNRSASEEVRAGSIASAIKVDETEGIYISLRPYHVDKILLQDVAGETMISRGWSVESDVMDIVVLQNATAIYGLGESDGIGNLDDQTVRIKVPVLLMLDGDGNVLLKHAYDKAVPDIERRFFSLSLVALETSGKAVLTGYERFKKEELSAALGRVEFPSVGRDKKTEVIATPPSSDNRTNPGETNNAVFIGVGVALGVVVFVVIVGTALWYTHKRGAGQAEAVVDTREDESVHVSTAEREYHALV